MSRKKITVLLIMMAFGSQLLFANVDTSIPVSVRNNQYHLESVRLAKLAEDTYEYGDYDTSANFAQESIRYAHLSQEYIALQLKILETNNAIAAARQRLDWAVSSGASNQYPYEYSEGETWYNTAVTDRAAEEWDDAIAAAAKVIDILAYVQAPGAPPSTPAPSDTLPLPAQYVVRTWASVRDCLWTIAGYSWVYGNPYLWPRLYDANKAKLPDVNNPDLIEPGTVLDIPSLNGEVRQGIWDPNNTYSIAR